MYKNLTKGIVKKKGKTDSCTQLSTGLLGANYFNEKGISKNKGIREGGNG